MEKYQKMRCTIQEDEVKFYDEVHELTCKSESEESMGDSISMEWIKHMHEQGIIL